MGRASVLTLVFLLSDVLLLGQQQVIKRLAATSCPIGVEASLVGLPSVLNAGSSISGQPAQRKGPSVEGPPTDHKQLDLDVTNPSSRAVVGAKFTARGFSRNFRVIALSDRSNTPDLAKTVDVVLEVEGKGHASSELSLTHFTAISSIDLDSVTYADGTRWQAPAPGACSIIPNMVMRIAAMQ